jgi:hypothetical protein
MVRVFSIFVTLPILDMKEFGIGLAAAVLIDATIVRGILLPAGRPPRRGSIRVGNSSKACRGLGSRSRSTAGDESSLAGPD